MLNVVSAQRSTSNFTIVDLGVCLQFIVAFAMLNNSAYDTMRMPGELSIGFRGGISIHFFNSFIH